MRVPPKPPNWVASLQARGSDALFQAFQTRQLPSVQEFVRYANDNSLHWDKLRFRPLPEGVDPVLAWAFIQMSRDAQRQELPVSFEGRKKFNYWLPPQHMEWLQLMDQQGGGTISAIGQSIPGDRDRYLFNSLMEEAIASSQLEGASTTRKVAKEMLRSKRRPRTKSEQMIANNYKAILEIRELKSEKLTPAVLLHLQAVLTENTMEPDEQGRFRTDADNVRVEDNSGQILHVPPPAETLPQRIDEICEFANSRQKPWVHPIIKAITLHFAIGYVHPFTDGNGRTARAVFYWYMLKENYWLFEFLPLSRVLITGPAKYAQAFLYTETDHGDTTYFNHYHLRTIQQAVRDLHKYLEYQARRLEEATALLKAFPGLNHRQSDSIRESLNHSDVTYTAPSYAGRYHVTYPTAKTDLVHLAEFGLLEWFKVGRTVVYRPSKDLVKKLKTGAGKPPKGVLEEKIRKPAAVTVCEKIAEQKMLFKN